MQLTINLPDRESTLAFHRQRWTEVVSDTSLADYPGRVETNAYGQIVMTPSARFIHGHWQSKIASKLEELIQGYCATETGIITSDGVKIVDVVWLSPRYFMSLRDPVVLESAPEICVEILSRSNTIDEIQNKFRLYFDAGAIECWQCDLQGKMTYCLNQNVETQHKQSILCPEFPAEISF